LGIEGEKEMKGNEAWKKTKTVLICLIFLIMNMSSNLFIESVKAEETDQIYYVPDDGALQNLINTSQDNDTIQINESMKLSSFIIINKSITVQGKNDELIHINGSNEFGFNINVTNVTVRNLTIHNCSTAITIENSTNSLENITLDNITIQNCSQHGISISNTTLSNITNLTIINCTQTGIYLQNSSNMTITENHINQTSNTGINITSDSNNNTIKNNTFHNNSISVNITSSENNTIVNNTFLNKTGTYHAFDNSANKWNTTTHGNYCDGLGEEHRFE
jgi:nitrous oxidase accessory protein